MPPEETTLLPISEFASFTGEWSNDDDDVVALVDNGDGRVSVMMLEEGVPAVMVLAEVSTDENGDTVLSWNDEVTGDPVTATINSVGDRITFAGNASFDVKDWFRTLPTTAPATTAAATTAAPGATTTAGSEAMTTTGGAIIQPTLPLPSVTEYMGEWTNDDGDVITLTDNGDGTVSVTVRVEIVYLKLFLQFKS